MNILITLCARGGSKGIPGKNIRALAGEPLISYTIKLAQRFAKQYKAKISLSTDSQEIVSVSRRFDLITDYVRPEGLATDTAGKVEVIGDLLLYEEARCQRTFDYILDLDITSPLRTLRDLENAFSIFRNSDAYTLFSVNSAARNPYFNMVEKKESGYYGLVKTDPTGAILSRQKAPRVYDLNASFYWYRRSFFSSNPISVFTDKSLIYEMDHICFDLDHTIDFEFLEFLIVHNKLDFELK
ncbi:acylneuraminate cytidylyltransferase family protein [Parapedobacter sp. 2B3]|uniref:acylneuraminate cytidylyltransferase family protein n=1 Tax=Parapedobacter sp. 2B3 TaxID=3342381 RepID=UPI0035B58AD8